MYSFVRQSNLTKVVIGCVKNEQEAKNQIKDFANKLNCPQKIIWQSDLSFKLLSTNGSTEKYYIIEVK